MTAPGIHRSTFSTILLAGQEPPLPHELRELDKAFDWCGKWQYLPDCVICCFVFIMLCIFFLWWAI